MTGLAAVCRGCGGPLPPRAKMWCSPRCRKRTLYSRACPECGVLMDGSGGHKTSPSLCARCSAARQHRERHWTPERVVAAIRDAADREGGIPPTAGQAASSGLLAAALREFGAWSAALEAAGYMPHIAGRPHGDPAERAECGRRYLAGESGAALAAEYGVTREAVCRRAAAVEREAA